MLYSQTHTPSKPLDKLLRAMWHADAKRYTSAPLLSASHTARATLVFIALLSYYKTIAKKVRSQRHYIAKVLEQMPHACTAAYMCRDPKLLESAVAKCIGIRCTYIERVCVCIAERVLWIEYEVRTCNCQVAVRFVVSMYKRISSGVVLYRRDHPKLMPTHEVHIKQHNFAMFREPIEAWILVSKTLHFREGIQSFWNILVGECMWQ